MLTIDRFIPFTFRPIETLRIVGDVAVTLVEVMLPAGHRRKGDVHILYLPAPRG